MLKVPEWRTWAFTDGSCHIQNGKQEVGAGDYCPLTNSKKFVEPNGAGITNTICRAELAAIAAAITHVIAKHQANQANNSVAGTGIPGAGPSGNPFSHLFCLAKEEKKTYCQHIHSSCNQS
eukprot:1155505-Pelagomonas_calceolata.AAC.1